MPCARARGRNALIRGRRGGAPRCGCSGALAGRGAASSTIALTCVAWWCAAVCPGSAAEPDAVVLRWDQHWTLRSDGSSIYHERKDVQVNNERAYGDFADPRITYDADAQTVEVLAARVKRPDGVYVELPPYGRTEVAPYASAGWPAFAAIRQVVLVLSGIEPGCIAEVEYRLTTAPGGPAFLAADLRLQDRYPIVSRTVRVDLPRGVELSPVHSNIDERACHYSFQQNSDGTSTHSWAIARLPAQPDEPGALPWPLRAARLTFSTAPDAADWLRMRLDAVVTAADSSERLTRLAVEWKQGRVAPDDVIRSMQERLAARLNFVEFGVPGRPTALRRASAVLDSGYGLPAETAGVLLALASAAGVPARPAMVVRDDVWVEAAPQDAFAESYVIETSVSGVREHWHPQHGRVTRDRRWAGCTILSLDGDQIVRTPIQAFDNPDESVVAVAVRAAVEADGTLAGTVNLRVGGLFVAAGGLRDATAQKARLAELIRRVLPGVDVADFTIGLLSSTTLEATARVKSPKPLERVGGAVRITLAQDGPIVAELGLPLSYARVDQPVRLAGACTETTELIVTYPDGWVLEAAPAAISRSGTWGRVGQDAAEQGNRLTLSRSTRLPARDLTAADWGEVRSAVNAIRAESARTILLRPPQ